MSVEALNWAFQQSYLADGPHRLLVTLADYADPDGFCWPSRRALADRLGKSIDTVDRRLAELQGEGLVAVVSRSRPGPHGGVVAMANAYQLQLRGRPLAAPGDAQVAAGGGRIFAATPTLVALAREDEGGSRKNAATGSRKNAATGSRKNAATGSRKNAATGSRKNAATVAAPDAATVAAYCAATLEPPLEPPIEPLPLPQRARTPAAGVAGDEGRIEGAVEGDGPDPRAVWTHRSVLEAAFSAAGAAVDLTAAAVHHAADLMALIQPTSGPPCDFERDVIPAIAAKAHKALAKGDPIRSWLWVRDGSLKNRDRRLQGLPQPRVAAQIFSASPEFCHDAARPPYAPPHRLSARERAAGAQDAGMLGAVADRRAKDVGGFAEPDPAGAHRGVLALAAGGAGAGGAGGGDPDPAPAVDPLPDDGAHRGRRAAQVGGLAG